MHQPLVGVVSHRVSHVATSNVEGFGTEDFEVWHRPVKRTIRKGRKSEPREIALAPTSDGLQPNGFGSESEQFGNSPLEHFHVLLVEGL